MAGYLILPVYVKRKNKKIVKKSETIGNYKKQSERFRMNQKELERSHC